MKTRIHFKLLVIISMLALFSISCAQTTEDNPVNNTGQETVTDSTNPDSSDSDTSNTDSTDTDVKDSTDTDSSDTEEETTALTAAEVITKMENGFNLGNAFDYGLQSTDPEKVKPVIDLYIEAGMKHIRIPVTWLETIYGDKLADEDGNVDFENERFKELQEIIDYALSKELYVVINTHHEKEFKENYDGSDEYNDIFTTLWTDIATHFKDYPQELIFELLNEPEGAFGDWIGGANPFDEDAIALTRQVYEVGHAVVRGTGGLNETRIIMVSTNGMGNHTMIEETYPSKDELPGKGEDKYLAIQVHTYDPWAFCGQDGENENYPGKDEIKTSIEAVFEHAKLLDTPINYGEFGVGRASNTDERDSDIVREYYHTVVQTVLEAGMSSTVWEDRGWYRLIDQDDDDNWMFINGIVPFMLEK